MHHRPWLMALVLPLVACGAKQESPAQGAADPRAFFGLKPCQCMVYKRAGSDDKLGVAVESSSTSVKSGATVDWVRLRINGTQVREEALLATPQQLELWQVVNDTGSWRMSASGVPLVKFPPETQTTAPQNFSGAAAFQAAGGPEQPFTLNSRADYATSSQDYRLDGATPKSGTGQRIAYALTTTDTTIEPWAEHARSFVANVGFTSLELDVDGSGVKHWDLDNVTTLGNGCPYDLNTPPPPDQLCGLSVP